MRLTAKYIGLVSHKDFAKYYVLSKANDTSFVTSCVTKSTNATSPTLAFTTFHRVVPFMSI